MGDLFLAASIRPAIVGVLSPSSCAADAGPSDALSGREELGRAPGPGSTATPPDAASRLLGACSETISRWFLVMRQCLYRERVRQQLFREEHGLPRGARLPFEPQPLTAAEKAVSDASEAMVRAMFGDSPADYARDRFLHALSTGDMRSFKIRLILIKIRDSLKGTPSYAGFSAGLEECIDRAELLSGCKPDPSPRRLSRAEQDRKRIRAAQREENNRNNPELPLIWPDKDAPAKGGEVPCGTFNFPGKPTPQGAVQYIEPPISVNAKKKGRSSISPRGIQDIEPVTNSVTVTLGKKKGKRGTIVRKAREYKSVDEIMEDIDAGKITPYESSDEISEDLKAGKITAVDALMFATALDRYSPGDVYSSVDMGADDEPEWDVSESEEEDELDDDVDRVRAERADFSLNPNGFGGCAGGYSTSDAEWNTEDNW